MKHLEYRTMAADDIVRQQLPNTYLKQYNVMVCAVFSFTPTTSEAAVGPAASSSRTERRLIKDLFPPFVFTQ